MKTMKTVALASLATLCALVSCGGSLTDYEKTAKEYMAANASKYAQFDVSGGKFTWTTTAAAPAKGCEKYVITYDFKSDTGTLYIKSASGKELEAKFAYTYNWEYDAEADTEEVGPSSFEYVEFTKGSEANLDQSSEEFDAGFYYGELFAVSYKLEGTAIVAVENAYALATAEAAE